MKGSFVFLILWAASLFLGSTQMHFSVAHAQVESSKETKFLLLYIGVTHEERLNYFPPGIKLDGDFRKVVSVEADSSRGVLRIRPINKGVATLIVKDSSGNKAFEYRLDVSPSDLTKIVREMKTLLNDIDGIQIKIVNNRVIVDGTVILPKQLNRIYSVIRQYGPLADTLVELSPLAQKKIAEFIERDINNPEIQVRAVNDKFFLEGLANGEDEKNRAEIIAKTYVPDLVVDAGEQEGVVKKRRVENSGVINLIKIKPAAAPAPSKMIQVVVHYVELKKDYERSFRFQWMPDIEDKTNIQFTNDSRAPGGAISTITGIVSNLLPKLNSAKSHGHAKVLQSTTLMVQEGKKGEIKAGQRVPISSVTSSGGGAVAGTSFVNVGINTTITPVIVNPQSDTISLDTQFQVSGVVGTTSSGPLISDNTINTVISVRSGQSAAIGGLISNSNSTGFNRLPSNVSSNPLVSLYASKSFQKDQSQFVVFITPIIKSSASAGSEKIKQKFRLKN